MAEALLEGLRNKEIGQKLNLAERSVKAHMWKMFNFFLSDMEGIPRVKLAMYLHENKALLGIRCRACGEYEA